MKKMFALLLVVFWAFNIYALDQETDKKEALVWGFSNAITKGIIMPEGRIRALREFVYNQMKPDPAVDPQSLNNKHTLDLIQGKIGWCDHQVRVFIHLAWYQGFTTRMVYLLNKEGTSSPHTIAEVDLNGRWVVVDVGNNIDFNFATRENMQKDFSIVTNNSRIKELAKENPCFADEEYLRMYIYPAKIVSTWIGKE